MNNFEKAIEIAVESIRHDAKLCGFEISECENWADMLDWFGCDSADMKDDIYYDLMAAVSRGELMARVMDDVSIEDNDGSIKTYRQIANAVRKQLFG